MQAFLAWLTGLLLNFLWGKASGAIKVAEKDQLNHQGEVDQAAQDMKKTNELKPESTAKDVDEAIDASISHF